MEEEGKLSRDSLERSTFWLTKSNALEILEDFRTRNGRENWAVAHS